MDILSHHCLPSRLSRILVPLTLLGALQSPASWAQGDALLEAAMPSPLAPQGLLLDLDTVGQRLIAVGERGHILISEDEGKSWKQASVPVRVTLTSSYFVDDALGWAVGHDGVVLRTQDGGLNWKRLLDGNRANDLVLEHALERVADIEAVLDAASEEARDEPESASGEGQGQGDLETRLEEAQIAAEDAEIFKSEGPSRPFLDLWFRNGDEGIVVGAFGLILHTRDGGESWTSISDRLDNPDGFHLNAIRQIGETLYIAAEAGTLYRSDDWGDSWELLDSPYEGSFFGIAGDGKGRVIAYGLRGHAFQSSDRGDSWTQIDTGTSASFFGGKMFDDGHTVLVGAAGTAIVTDTHGQLIQTLQTAERQPLSMVLESGDGTLLLVGAAGLQTAQVQTENAQ